MKKRISALALALALCLGLLPSAALAADTPSSWAAEAVNTAISANLVPASLQGDYTRTATRAEFCALATALYESVTGAEITGRSTFDDTSDVNVQKMASLGVVSGVGNGRFDPGGTLTREQAATMLARLSSAVGRPLTGQTLTFDDSASISSWAREAVGQMQASGIMGGTGNNVFSPAGGYSREQSIATILRLYQSAGNTQPTPSPTPAPTPTPQPAQKTLSTAPLYEDSRVKITFVRIEKSKYDDNRVELYLDVDNKTGSKLTVQCDAVSLNGYCFNQIVMSDDISANSIGTVNASIEGFDFSLVKPENVETVGGQFRIIPGGVGSDSYEALFNTQNIYTAQKDNTIPSAGNRAPLYSDSKIELYFDHAEPDRYSSDGSRLEIYLMARNKTGKTLLIQNDTVTVDRRSYGQTIMSDPVLPYSAGYVNVSVEEYTGPSASSITTIGGDFHIIDDAGRDSYTATLGSLSSLGDDPAPSGGDTPPSGETTRTEGGTLLNYASGPKDPSAVYPDLDDPVPDFGAIYGLTPDPDITEVAHNDQSYWYRFYVGPGGFTESDIVHMRNEYLRRSLVGSGFSNMLGTSDLGDGAADQFVRRTANGTQYVHFTFATSSEINYGFVIVSISYR